MKKLHVFIVLLVFIGYTKASYGNTYKTTNAPTSKLAVFHNDKIYQEYYGNVVTFIKIPFENYAVTEKIKVIGKLAQQLSAKLAYKDTIFIEFHHLGSTSYRPEEFTIVEKDYSYGPYMLYKPDDYNIYDPYDYIVSNQKKSADAKENNCIAIRHIGLDMSVENTLKYIEYCILHKTENINALNTYNYTENWAEPEPIRQGSYMGIPPTALNTIATSTPSKTLTALLSTKTYIIQDKDIAIYYTNSAFYFKNKHISFNSSTFFYLVAGKKGYLFFYHPYI